MNLLAIKGSVVIILQNSKEISHIKSNLHSYLIQFIIGNGALIIEHVAIKVTIV